jgi:hypothetical protein
VDVFVFARDDAIAGKRIRTLDDTMELRSLGISSPMAGFIVTPG